MTEEGLVDDPGRAAAMIAAGGRLDRHSFVMVLDPAVAPPSTSLAVGFSIAPMNQGRVAEYGEVLGRAYPPGHPDHEPADADPESAAEALRRCMRGEQIGPWMAEASLHVSDHAGRVSAESWRIEID